MNKIILLIPFIYSFTYWLSAEWGKLINYPIQKKFVEIKLF